MTYVNIFTQKLILGTLGWSLFTLISYLDKKERPSLSFHISIGKKTALISNYILEQIFIRFNSTEEYNNFEEEKPAKKILMLEEEKILK